METQRSDLEPAEPGTGNSAMNDTHLPDRAERGLPVTAEVGSEGGSYADATAQVATFLGDVARHDGAGSRGSAAAHAIHRDAAAQESPTSGMVRYPTEAPLAPAVAGGRWLGTGHWRAGLIGAAAGAAFALVIARLLNRSR